MDPRYFGPNEVETLLGDASEAKEKLGWQTKIKFKGLVKEMVVSDLKDAEKDVLGHQEGFSVLSRYE